MTIFPEYQQLIDQKLAKQASLIPLEWRLPKAVTDKVSPRSNASAFDLMLEHQILTREELDITENYTATALVESMAAGKLTSLQVTAAFCKRSAVAQQLVRNALIF
jgi:amidase